VGLRSWLRQAVGGRVAHRQDPEAPEEQMPAPPPFKTRVSMSYHPCVGVAGTTTFAKEAVTVLADRHGMGVPLAPSHAATEESTHAPRRTTRIRSTGRATCAARSSAGCPLRNPRTVLREQGRSIPTRVLASRLGPRVLIQPYKQVIAVIALMHVLGLFCLVGASHPIKQQMKLAK
jgi:hypothetical protein